MQLALLAGLAAALATESVDAEMPGQEVRAVRSGGAEPPASAAVVQAEGVVRKRELRADGGARAELRADSVPLLAAVETARVNFQPKPPEAGKPAPVEKAKVEPAKVEPAKVEPQPAEGAAVAKDPNGDADPGGPGDMDPDLPAGTWGILTSQPYLLCLLGLGTLVLAAVFCLSLTSDDDPLRGVMATVPLTPLELLPHREYQIVKTRGLVTPSGEGDKKAQLFNSPLTSELCVYSRTCVEQHTATGWEQLLDFVEARPFSLAERGAADPQILVEVSANSPAVLDLQPGAVFDGDLVQLPPPVQQRIRALPGPKLPAYSMFRVSEWTVTEGQELEAMGLVLRRVSRRETRTALGVGGLSATNADYIASLFSPMRVSRWRTVGNKVVLGLPSPVEEEEK